MGIVKSIGLRTGDFFHSNCINHQANSICATDLIGSFELILPCVPSGARSEALASALLELHGLQDMLDKLRAWVAEAEERMSQTEAMPIPNNIEDLEKQLASHEVCVRARVCVYEHMCVYTFVYALCTQHAQLMYNVQCT